MAIHDGEPRHGDGEHQGAQDANHLPGYSEKRRRRTTRGCCGMDLWVSSGSRGQRLGRSKAVEVLGWGSEAAWNIQVSRWSTPTGASKVNTPAVLENHLLEGPVSFGAIYFLEPLNHPIILGTLVGETCRTFNQMDF